MHRTSWALLLAAAGLVCAAGRAADAPDAKEFSDDFGGEATAWQPTDAAAWAVQEVDRDASGKPGRVYRLLKQSDYRPPYRSPFNFSLIEDLDVQDFTFEADVRSTVKDYDHRDMVVVFGYQDAAHFYYVHFGKKADDHANNIFIVNGAPRTKIAQRTSPGTDWNDAWRHVKIVRNAKSGSIDVYFEDMKNPVMHAEDVEFTHGQIGVGSFDDTGDWDNVKVTSGK